MNKPTGLSTRHHHGSLWGAFTAVVEDGRVVAAEAFDKDEAPSPLIHSLPDAVHSDTRVARPYVRAGWLEEGPGGRRERRGAAPRAAAAGPVFQPTGADIRPGDTAIGMDRIRDRMDKR